MVDDDLSSLRLSSEVTEGIQSTRIVTSVSFASPGSKGFFRSRGTALGPFAILTDPDSKDVFVLPEKTIVEAMGQHRLAYVFAAITRLNDPFFVVRKVSQDGRENPWSTSLEIAIQESRCKWVRATANMSAQRYDVFIAKGDLPEPEWPEGKSNEDLLRMAVGDRIIRTSDHPVLKKLRGEV